MNVVVLIVFAFFATVAGLFIVLHPRPVIRTAVLAAFVGLIFAQLDVPVVVFPLAALAIALLVIDLLFFRERPTDDIGDRQTASATIEDDWSLVALSRTGDRAAFYLDGYLAGEDPALTDDVRSVVDDLHGASDKAQDQLIQRGAA